MYPLITLPLGLHDVLPDTAGSASDGKVRTGRMPTVGGNDMTERKPLRVEPPNLHMTQSRVVHLAQAGRFAVTCVDGDNSVMVSFSPEEAQELYRVLGVWLAAQ
jgi:hypothetical protein